MIRTGVPVHFRPLLWQCLAKIDTSNIKQKYVEYMKMTSPCEKVIRRDISRTYPEHEFFKEKHGIGQERLFNVIKVRNFEIKIQYLISILFSRLIHYSIVKLVIVKALVLLSDFYLCMLV
jgi:hypothetical protein